MRPDLSRVSSFYHNYISQVPENEIRQAFSVQGPSFISFLESIPENKYDFRYAEGKWSIKEVLQHIIDAERVFSYRALRFARKDTTPLAGFDENAFAESSNANARTWNDLFEEFTAVRKSSALLFHSFDEDQLQCNGISSNTPNYVLAIGYIIVGHAIHHQKIVKERYL